MADLSSIKVILGNRQHTVGFRDAAEALRSSRVRVALGLQPDANCYAGREVTLRELLLMARLGHSLEAAEIMEREGVSPLSISDLGLPLPLSTGTAVLLKHTPIVDAVDATAQMMLGENIMGAVERVPQSFMRTLPRIFNRRLGDGFNLSYPTETQARELMDRYEGTTMGQETNTIAGFGVRWFFLADQGPVADAKRISLWSFGHRGRVDIQTNRAVKPYYGAILVNAA